MGADGDIDAFENYFLDAFDDPQFEQMMDYWIHHLDDTNTPFPSMASTPPTSAPSGFVEQYLTTNEEESGSQTTHAEDVIIHRNGNEGNETKVIVIVCVVVGLLMLMAICGFLIMIYKCYKRNKARNMDGMVALPSTSELQLNDVDGGIIDEKTALTPESTHL